VAPVDVERAQRLARKGNLGQLDHRARWRRHRSRARGHTGHHEGDERKRSATPQKSSGHISPTLSSRPSRAAHTLLYVHERLPHYNVIPRRDRRSKGVLSSLRTHPARVERLPAAVTDFDDHLNFTRNAAGPAGHAY